MRMTPELHLGRVAHHEIAHAVVALHFTSRGLEVGNCTITPAGDGRYTGVTGVDSPAWEDDRDVADALVIVYAAGAVGARRYLSEAGIRNARWWAERSAWHDEEAFDRIRPCSSLTWDAATSEAERILTDTGTRIGTAAARLAADLYLPAHLI